MTYDPEEHTRQIRERAAAYGLTPTNHQRWVGHAFDHGDHFIDTEGRHHVVAGVYPVYGVLRNLRTVHAFARQNNLKVFIGPVGTSFYGYGTFLLGVREV